MAYTYMGYADICKPKLRYILSRVAVAERIFTMPHHQIVFAVKVLARHQPEEPQPLNSGDHSRIITGHTQLNAAFQFRDFHCPALIPRELSGVSVNYRMQLLRNIHVGLLTLD